MKALNYLCTLAMLVGLCLPMNAGETFVIGNYTYEITGENTVSLVRYIPNVVYLTNRPKRELSPEYAYALFPPETVEHEGSTYTVTAIGDDVFKNCSMYYLRIPDGVVTIGKNVARNSSIIYLVIPDKVVSIGDYSFCDCHSLVNVVLGKSFREAGECVFLGCYDPIQRPLQRVGIEGLRLIYKSDESPTLPVGKRYNADRLDDLPPIEMEGDSMEIVYDDPLGLYPKTATQDYTLPMTIKNCRGADLPYYSWSGGPRWGEYHDTWTQMVNENGLVYDDLFKYYGNLEEEHTWTLQTNLHVSAYFAASDTYRYFEKIFTLFSPTQACFFKMKVFGSQDIYDRYLADVPTETVDGGAVISVVYYDLHGRAHDRPQPGVNVVATTYTDGKTVTKKTIVP